MKKVFMIGLGGSIKGANVEVHAMQFVAADTLEDTFQELRKRWYGDSLHIDSYIELKYIDGYRTDLSNSIDDELFMIVYGGYQKSVVNELHEYTFVVSDSQKNAKQIAKKKMGQFTHMDHVDEVVNVFENLGIRFGLVKGNYTFKENKINHTFIKL